MALTINLDTQANVDALVAEYQRLTLQLANLPIVDVSDQGRSVSNSGQIIARMQQIRLMIVAAAGPAEVKTVMRTGNYGGW